MEVIRANLSRVRVIDVLSTAKRLSPCPDMSETIYALGALVVIEEQILAAYNSLEMIEPDFPTASLSPKESERPRSWRAAVLAVEGAMTEIRSLRSEIVRAELSLNVSSEAERATSESEVRSRRSVAAA